MAAGWCFGVGSDGADGEAGRSMKGGFTQYGIRGRLVRHGWRIRIGFTGLGRQIE
jgi:hypothetical protein